MRPLRTNWFIRYSDTINFRKIIIDLNKYVSIPFKGKSGYLYGVTAAGKVIACSDWQRTAYFPSALELIFPKPSEIYDKDSVYQAALRKVTKLLQDVTCELFGKKITITAYLDKRYGKRVYIQASYTAPCTKTGAEQEWTGRKWYLSDHMTNDEIIKTAYCAFEAAVKHEIMEGFKVGNLVLFNPHVSYLELLKISNKEVKRK